MKILLIYPKYPETFWSFKYALKFVAKKAAFPPLGLLTVAAMLPKSWSLKLVDLNTDQLLDQDILWADMVFLSGMLVQKESVLEIISRVKSLGRKVVGGGPIFTAQPEQFPEVDHLVLNEGEVTLPIFLQDLERGELKRVYTSGIRPDITKTPLPKWSLIDVNKYATMPIQYSRGCPFNCEFCDIIILNGRKPRTKTPEQMVAELEALYQTGWRAGVFIVDDNFIGNKKNVKGLLPEVIRWQRSHKYPFTFLTEASVNLAEDPELMDLMSAANFNKVFLGLETPSLDSLKECGKFQNANTDLAEVVKTIQEHGLQVMAGFIVGFDNDTQEIFETQIRFIQKIGVVTAMVGMLGALPQTRLWHRLQAEGRLLDEYTGNNTAGELNFIPRMGVKPLMQGYERVISTIYSPREYYRRINVFLKNYRPKARTKLHHEDIRAFLMSTWRIGICSKASFWYWKLIVKTVLTKIKALPEAIELAIYGYHFEKIAKNCKKKIMEYFEDSKDDSQLGFN